MAFFVDANIPVYAAGSSARAQPCRRLLEAIAEGAPGMTSVAVVEEVWHLELRGRPAGIGGLARNVLELFSPLLEVTEASLRAALEVESGAAAGVAAGPGAALGSNDRLHLAVCGEHGIDVIVSADEAFDAVGRITRVDPLDAAAMGELSAA